MENDDGNEFAPQGATSEAKMKQLQVICDKYRGDARATQRLRLREALRQFPVSTFEARRYLDVMHPAGRIKELRGEGNEIDTLRLSKPSDIGRPHRIAVYVYRKGAGDAG